MSKITHTLEKRETFIYNHGQPTRAHETHNAHQTPTGPGKPRARGPARPQRPIRTTITVTLSAEPRCTALVASRLQAAS